MRAYFRYLNRRASAVAVVFGFLAAASVAALTAVSSREFLWAALCLAAAFAVLALAFYKWVAAPYRQTAKILLLFATGYTIQDIFAIRCPISPEMEAAFSKVRELFSTQDLINASKRHSQYLALQNQINPHFLYNTLEGIRGEAIAAKMTTVAEMTEALSTFFRYTISNTDNMVTVEDELRNAENYFLIQRYRFGDRINLIIDCDEADREEIYKLKMPKLTLQPIVENAIIHGVERKLGRGDVRIRMEITAKRLIITVSDNGAGMDVELLNSINARLNSLSFEQREGDRGGIAIVNVNNRIKLLFGEEYGVFIYSAVNEGTDVSITLPRFAAGDESGLLLYKGA